MPHASDINDTAAQPVPDSEYDEVLPPDTEDDNESEILSKPVFRVITNKDSD